MNAPLRGRSAFCALGSLRKPEYGSQLIFPNLDGSPHLGQERCQIIDFGKLRDDALGLVRNRPKPVIEEALHDVRQDELIWKHKANIGRPMLAEGDGPIGPYRRWAQQFHGMTAGATERSA